MSDPNYSDDPETCGVFPQHLGGQHPRPEGPRLTEAALAELARLERAASYGPWRVNRANVCHPGTTSVEQEGSLIDWVCHMQVSNQPRWHADAELIAAMRNALPSLLADLAQARADLAAARESARKMEGFANAALRVIDGTRQMLLLGHDPQREADVLAGKHEQICRGMEKARLAGTVAAGTAEDDGEVE